MTVNLAISGTATPGADYVPLDNPVTIPDGASSVTLQVIAFDDLFFEPTENVIVDIAPGTNYNVGNPSEATVQILDNGYPRRVQPTDAGYAVYVSNDLKTWNTGPDYVRELSAVADTNGITETVTAEVTAPYSQSTNQYVTVRVWLMTTGPP